ncbi:MAG: FkbM family methyltransferase [Candidatus Bathyarchaeota archaeon]|nr:FkbM family methyltransferase [Candidatus Bathyarchaeota archaeon]
MDSQDAKLLKVQFSGIVYSRPYDAYFYVRAFSDDLYSILPRREEDVCDLILSSIKSGDTFIDVGANIGCYSILVGKIVGKNGHVISIEPTPLTTQVLKYNLELNGLRNTKVIQKAAWNSKESKMFFVPKGFFGWGTINRPKCSVSTYKVETMCLDELQGINKIDLLKIDAETAELQILKGAKNLLQKTKTIVLEASEDREQIISFLIKNGFKVRPLKFCSYLYATKDKLS